MFTVHRDSGLGAGRKVQFGVHHLFGKYLLNTNTQVVVFNAAMFQAGTGVVLLVSKPSYQVGTIVITREVKKSTQGYRKEPGSLAPT